MIAILYFICSVLSWKIFQDKAKNLLKTSIAPQVLSLVMMRSSLLSDDFASPGVLSLRDSGGSAEQ